MGKVNWAVYSYDVWGNAEDGYEINDTHRVMMGANIFFAQALTVQLYKCPTTEQVIEALIEAGYVSDKARGAVEDDDCFGGDIGTIYLKEKEDGRPLCELRRIEDEETE